MSNRKSAGLIEFNQWVYLNDDEFNQGQVVDYDVLNDAYMVDKNGRWSWHNIKDVSVLNLKEPNNG